MAPVKEFGGRRREITRRRPPSRRAMALWIALLLCGLAVVVAASNSLIAASSARTQNVAAEQRYFEPTPASHQPALKVRSGPARPVDTAPVAPKPTSRHRSSPPSAVSTSAVSVTPRPSTSLPTQRPVEAVPFTPTSIQLARSSEKISVVPIGVSSDGVLEPPHDILIAGWWVSGPRPGAPGRAVITGHIDSTAGLGAFAALDLLHPGDTIALYAANGSTLHFKVTARQEIEKTELDPSLLQHTTNRSDLLLVTCIGNFDDSTLSYDSNLLITAVPVLH